ncbi:hypothetical protein D9M68_880910 [compost metagenome]
MLRSRLALTPVLSAEALMAAASSSREFLPSPSVSMLARLILNEVLPWPMVSSPWVSMSSVVRPCSATWWALANCSTKNW